MQSRRGSPADSKTRPRGPLRSLQRTPIALILTWVAGFVDLLGFVFVYNIYIAHMSGNTVAMARHLSHDQMLEAIRHGWPIMVFVIGMIFGSVIFEAQMRDMIRIPVPATLALETILLAIFLYTGSGVNFQPNIPPQPAAKYYLVVALLTLAMGLQNVTIRKVGGLNIYTTFVTGTLVRFAESAAEFIFWIHDRMQGGFRLRARRIFRILRRNPPFRHMALTGALWISYMLGALCGGFAGDRYALLAMAVPLGVLIVITIYATFRPFILLVEEQW
jgi:uncharacterized membrane protein YoaK (UPF0700 family)